MRALNDNMNSILKLGAVSSNKEADAGAISKYMQKLSSLTAPQTEMDMKDINMAALADENNTLVIMLRKRLEEKTKFAAVLEQGVRSSQASTDVLQSQIDSIRINREQSKKEIKEAKQGNITLKQLFNDRGKKQVMLKKEINRLELQMKDLRVTVEQSTDKERRAAGVGTEARKKSDELMRQLISVRITNTKLLEQNESKGEDLLEEQDRMQAQQDSWVRDANAAKVKVIALKKKYEEVADDIVAINESIQEIVASLARVRETMRTEAVLEGAAIDELRGRLGSEEAANKMLCAQLGEKEKNVVRLETAVKTATEARKMLSAQLEEKMTLSLELSNRIQQLQEHTLVLESRLGDKNIEAEGLTKSLDMVKADVKVLELQLTKEEHNMTEANRVLKEQQLKVEINDRDVSDKVDADQTMSLQMTQITTNTALVQSELDSKCNNQERIKTRLMVTEERKMMLGQQIEDLESSFAEMTTRYKQVCDDHTRTQTHLKEKTKQLLQEEHETKLALNELQNTLRQRTDTIVQLKNGLMLNDVKIRDLTEMLENASVSAERNKQQLSKRATEIAQANRLLSDEIEQEKSRGKLLEGDLVNVESRLRSSLAQLKAQESTAQGFADVNNQDQDMVMVRLQEQTAKVERLNNGRAQVKADIQKWRIKLEDQVSERERAERLLKDEKTITNKLRDQSENELDRELEQKSRMKMLEKHNTALDKQLEAKTEAIAKTKIDLDDFEAQVEMIGQEVREKELKNKELVGIQGVNISKINQLKQALTDQEKSHISDARAVKLSIVNLQDGLMEKVSQVELLVRTTQQLKAKIAEAQTRLTSTEAAAQNSQQRNQDMLSDEQRLSASLRGVQENKLRAVELLRNGIQSKEMKIQTLQNSMIESGNKAEVLKSDVFTKRKESDMMVEQLVQKEAIEKSMAAKMGKHEEDIAILRQTLRERTMKINAAEKGVKEATFENRLLKRQLQEKMKAERYLLAELEGLRLQVNTNKNPGNSASTRAQIAADKAFSGVLTKSLKK